MKASLNAHARPPAVHDAFHDALMFGCESALPFLTDVQGAGAPRRAFSGLALGAVVALSACDAGPQATPPAAPTDKVSAAFAKVDREITRTKARMNWSEKAGHRMAESASESPAPR
jgi:hypothetical protein